MAEWLGSGLQHHLQRFESARYLNNGITVSFTFWFKKNIICKFEVVKKFKKMNASKLLISIFSLLILFKHVTGQSFDGFALYNKSGNSTTYLIDENENIAHTWNLSTECNYAVLLKNNGNIVRGAKNNIQTGGSYNYLGGAAEGGRVQEIDPNGNIVWDFIYSSSSVLSHHDICLIGDNVLLTAWEFKSQSDLINAGYTGNVSSSGKWPTHFVEIQGDPNTGTAQIVWEWHIWDHLCQDVDPTKPNYVNNISDHPELIDINMIQNSGGGPGGGGGDWFHVNGVDYNADLDQIAFSSRFASEIYIIDHSTSTAEAASHSGGNSGMGGDILYRWGNPSNYGMLGAQIIPNAVHDVRWIEDDGRTNGGFLQIFNNSGGGNNQSTIDGIETPKNGYIYFRTPGQPYGPTNYTTRYNCQYSAPGQSASDRMSNGNIFVNASSGQGGAGVMYEVDINGNIVWGPYNAQSQKAFRYECSHPGIIALQQFINTSSTSCFLPSSINSEKNINDLISIFPNPFTEELTLNFKLDKISYYNIKIESMLGEEVYNYSIENVNNEFFKKIDLSYISKGIYSLTVMSKFQTIFNKKIVKF